MDTVILFDLDGTLTPPRKSMDLDMLEALCTLDPFADIGIVSGSPMSYISEQAKEFLLTFDRHPDCGQTYIMPCNGTQLYLGTGDGYDLVESNNMKDELGEEVFHDLIRVITQLQLWALEQSSDWGKMPLSGTFIQYRDSMLNWSPSGRDGDDDHRRRFVEFDNKSKIRDRLRKTLRTSMDIYDIKNVDVVLGGSTSLDIYPAGWDKTYALKHVEKYSNVIFVGDKCMPGGNDYTLYEKLYPAGRSYSVTGPEDTLKLINDVLIPGLKARKQN